LRLGKLRLQSGGFFLLEYCEVCGLQISKTAASEIFKLNHKMQLDVGAAVSSSQPCWSWLY